MTVIQAVQRILGPSQIRCDEQARNDYATDRSTLPAECSRPMAQAVLFPESVAQVQALVYAANEGDFALVPSGGRTGLSGGALALRNEFVLSLERMRKMLEFDPVDRSIRVEAGMVTRQVQDLAREHGMHYPVDFASSGSSQIGGNIATNAGGIQVIRYGMTREWVRGLKVITGRGELLDLNHGLLKNNTGYDLRHLMIGSEGTLGIIVEATLGLCKAPRDPTVMLLGVRDMAAIMRLLEKAREDLALTAFEFFSDAGMRHVIRHTGLQAPFAEPAPFYVLLEFETAGDDSQDLATHIFSEAMDAGLASDGVLARSGAEARRLWRLREDMSESLAPLRPYKNDIAVRVSRMPDFLAECEALVAERYPGFEVIWYGHIGDGNLHLNILRPAEMSDADFSRHCRDATAAIGELLQRFEGSVSAEHGVGLLKKSQLAYSRSPEELRLMRAMKSVFDPQHVLNPGKVFDL